MSKFITALSLLIFLFPGVCLAQLPHLSNLNLKKLNKIESAHKRLVSYYKFYKRDSIRLNKQLRRKFKRSVDSTFHEVKKEEQLKQLRSKIANDENLPIDSIRLLFSKLDSLQYDTLSIDSLRSEAKRKLKLLLIHQLEKEQNKALGIISTQEFANGLIPKFGIIRGGNEFPGLAQEAFEDRLPPGIGGVKDIIINPTQVKDSMATSMENMKEKVKDKALEKSTNYILGHGQEFFRAQQKLSKALSRYKALPGSNDSSTAVRRTSLKGNTFKEHLYIACNHNLVKLKPFSLDLLPEVGYKFNTRFLIGLGYSGRLTVTDTIPEKYHISFNKSGLRLFSSLMLFGSYFAQAEWERSWTKYSRADGAHPVWKDNYFVGLGKKMLVHAKFYLFVTLLYNLNNEQKEPFHRDRFQVRMGLQLSELATRTKKIFYDPNR